MPRQRPDLQEWLVGTFLGCEPRCFQQGSFLKLWADCPLWPLQTPATTGQSRRCSLDRPWAGYTQVTALWPMGSESCSCSQGPNWLMVQFHAYYFKAVFLAQAWQACLRHLATMIRMPLFSRKLTIDSSMDSQGKAHLVEPTCSKEKYIFIN